jgi:hypothetical protein
MKDDDFDSWGRILLCLVILVAFLYFSGCATAPSMSITDADVDAKIAAIGAAVPEDPGADVYNETTDRYELTPTAHDRALRDGIVKRIQDEKIATMNEYLVKHPPATFKVKATWFSWGMLAGVILTIAGGFAISQ